MIRNELRVGNFTSSEIYNLMTDGKQELGLGKPATTYIEDKRMEVRLGRSLKNETSARETSWGKLVEGRVFDLLGIEYQLVSTDTILHPKIKCWSGSPDGNKFDVGNTVIDIKAPLTLKSFCRLVDPLYNGLSGMDAMNEVRKNHPDGEKYYWQLVSNSVLTGSKFAELIPYVPYKSELDEIREYASQVDSIDQYKFFWINNAQDDELPYLIDGGFYKNLNVIRFEVPEEDKIALTERVLMCGVLLQSAREAINKLEELQSLDSEGK